MWKKVLTKKRYVAFMLITLSSARLTVVSYLSFKDNSQTIASLVLTLKRWKMPFTESEGSWQLAKFLQSSFKLMSCLVSI